MIDVVLLGTGATMPTPERGVSAAVLRCGGRSILFDCGEGTQVALRREKISPVKIDLIALTHYHGDHIFGLPGFLQTVSCLGRTDPLYITGPEGLEDAMRPILQLAGQLSYEVKLAPFDDPRGCEMQRFHPDWPLFSALMPIPTEHRVPSQGYSFHLGRVPLLDYERIAALGIPKTMWKELQQTNPVMPVEIDGQMLLREDGTPLRITHLVKEYRKGLHVVFTGDTMPCRDLRLLVHETDLLIHDATYPSEDDADEAEKWGHSTFCQAAELARDRGVKRLWLTHFSQSIDNTEPYLEIARGVFPNTECGYDGKAITLRFEK